jgi:polysaccharide biosynthesis protein PslG
MSKGIKYDEENEKYKSLRFLLFFLAIVAIAVGGVWIYNMSYTPNIATSATETTSGAPTSLSTSTVQSNPVGVTSTVSPVNSFVGIATGDTLPFLTANQLNSELNTMVSLGITWIRLDMAWNDVQPNNSETFKWGNLDRVVAAANARHLKILPTLGYTPMWGRPSGCTSSEKCPPANPALFAAFASAAVQRYAPEGITTWEIWNEPNGGFWEPVPDPLAYTTLLKLTYTAIKKIQPSSIVITGGLAPAANTATTIAPITFLQDIYSDGGEPYFDAVGFHPYTYPVLPSTYQPSSAWSQMDETDLSLRSVMGANGDSGKLIWLTEYGAPTGGPGGVATDPTDTGDDHVTDALQARLIRDAVTSARNLPWAGPLFIYSYEDLGDNSDTVENFFGLLWTDGTPKPAFTLLQQLLSPEGN